MEAPQNPVQRVRSDDKYDAKRTVMRRNIVALMLVGGLCVATGSAHAQLAPASPMAFTQLSEEEVKAKYQNCPNGYYSGPRPGKSRYTKDKFLWVVTPEFAARFCMPPEFVSNELKGAEAVAFRVVENLDEERCGWGGREEVCGIEKELRFEIYYKTGLIPKRNEVQEWLRPVRSSNMLISSSASQWEAFRLQAEAKRKAKIFHEAPFTNQFGLVGIEATKVVWPIVSLYQQAYFQDMFTGIDYLSIQGSTGFFTNPRMEKLGIKKFVIIVDYPKDNRRSLDKPLSEFAHIVEFPEWFVDKVRQADKTRGTNVEALGRAAFGMPPAPAMPTASPSK